MIVMHIDANSAYLSWTAVKMLEEGCGYDIRDIPSAIAGDPNVKSLFYQIHLNQIGDIMIVLYHQNIPCHASILLNRI